MKQQSIISPGRYRYVLEKKKQEQRYVATFLTLLALTIIIVALSYQELLAMLQTVQNTALLPLP